MADFLEVIGEMRNGDVLVDCSARLTELVESIEATGGKGKMTLTLDFKPGRLGDNGRVVDVEVEHTITLKKPERKPGVSVFFVTQNSKLTRQDPRQTEMFEERAMGVIERG